MISPRRRSAASAGFASASLRRRAGALLVGLLIGTGALSACSSNPSNKRVVLDAIEALDWLSPAARDCMTARVDRYSNEQLTDIAEANEDFTINESGELQAPTTALEDFQADLANCVADNPVGGSGSVPASEPATTLG